MFAETLSDLQFNSSLADPDVWLRPAMKKNGEQYYKYIFVYVDDLLIISEKINEIIKTLSDSYRLKNDSISKPTSYLGAEIRVFRDPDCPSVEMRSMSANKYLKEAIGNVDRDLEWLSYKLPIRVNTPLSHKYRPELDITAFLDDDYTRWFQQLIGIL
jgi:hypothetical protein